jgi:hypothetical protein
LAGALRSAQASKHRVGVGAAAGNFLGADQPVISVDTKRKELVGNFKKGDSFYAMETIS